MRDKREITLPFEKAEKVIDSPTQIVKISDENGWTGEVINKSEIVWTQRDTDRERQEAQKELDKNALQEGNLSPEDKERLRKERAELIAKMKPDFTKYKNSDTISE